MKRRLSRFAGLILLVACLSFDGPPASRAALAVATPQMSLTRLPPEVRLRKLHLVRPDLIQYPIMFEVYC